MSHIPTVKANKFSQACLNDEMFLKWYEHLSSQKESTAYSYKYGLMLFCEFTKKSPSELVKEAREDYVARVPPWEYRHQNQIEAFITHLKKAEQSKNTGLARVRGIKNFYSFYKIPVTVINERITTGVSEKYSEIPVLKLEDIRKAVVACGADIMKKALILTLLSSGQGQAEIRSLKGKHLKNIENGVAVVSMTRGKTNRKYNFFIGHEALAAIREYKSDLKDDDYVFTGEYSGEQLIAQDVDGYVSRIAKLAELDRDYFAPHRTRHYWKTVLTGKMDSTFIEYLMGHKLPGTESSYFLGNKEAMLEQYLKNQHLLTVSTSQEILQKQYDELKLAYDSGTVKIKEDVQAIRAELEVRKNADDELSKLFSDPDVQQLLLKKMREFKLDA